MKIFAPLYHKTEELTKHAPAPVCLYGLTFAEQTLTIIRRTNAGCARRALVGVRFVPLVENA